MVLRESRAGAAMTRNPEAPALPFSFANLTAAQKKDLARQLTEEADAVGTGKATGIQNGALVVGGMRLKLRN